MVTVKFCFFLFDELMSSYHFPGSYYEMIIICYILLLWATNLFRWIQAMSTPANKLTWLRRCLCGDPALGKSALEIWMRMDENIIKTWKTAPAKEHVHVWVPQGTFKDPSSHYLFRADERFATPFFRPWSGHKNMTKNHQDLSDSQRVSATPLRKKSHVRKAIRNHPY